MRKESTARVLNGPLNDFLKRTGVAKKSVSVDMDVSQQTITDWTKEVNAKPVTADNGVKLSKIANDSTLTQWMGYFYFGMPPALDGEYELNLADLDDLRELEEEERDAKQDEIVVRRALCKHKKLEGKSREEVLELAREQAEVCIVNNQYLFALCDRLGISSMDLVERYMSRWIEEGYFGGDN
ncbi:hypothetical protein [Enterococcus sp. AZ109]|uniref:hypothetical protein n=1 Tax=Enterococcus sp. AZ109 TaxID=2774634 RepID=UPI003F232F71